MRGRTELKKAKDKVIVKKEEKREGNKITN